MHNLKEMIKATIKIIIVALLFAICLLAIIYFTFKNEIKTAISYINLVSIDDSKYEHIEASIDEKTNKIKNYPEYGTEYAKIKIDKIDVDLPVYFGDDLNTLKKGVGHSSRKLFSRRRWLYSLYGS